MAIDDEPDGPGGSVPGLVRVAATAWWHTSGWALQTSLRVSRRLMEAAASPASAIELAQQVEHAARALLREAREVVDSSDEHDDGHSSQNGRVEVSPSTLREEGEELLRRSRDVHYQERSHPAYERILSELAPDEARILRLLLLEGPQPAVDIRTGGPVGVVRSRLIAPGLSMIGAQAGCRYVERVPSYLNNLFRLGLIWFSRETLRDPLRYQVLEAQPDVLEAIGSVRQAKVVRRSIHLTPFGEDLCRVALCTDTDPQAELPPHSAPTEISSTPPIA